MLTTWAGLFLCVKNHKVRNMTIKVNIQNMLHSNFLGTSSFFALGALQSSFFLPRLPSPLSQEKSLRQERETSHSSSGFMFLHVAYFILFSAFFYFTVRAKYSIIMIKK